MGSWFIYHLGMERGPGAEVDSGEYGSVVVGTGWFLLWDAPVTGFKEAA